MMLRKVIFFVLLISYTGVFFYQEKISIEAVPQLAFPMPAMVAKSVLGFLRQLGGEMYYIKASVFLGALDPSKPMDAHADSLASNFEVMSELNPYFVDTYFLCESGLAHIGPQQAREANTVLARGMEALPDNWFLPFFKGFNHFNYLKENRQAAEDLLKASKLPNGPPWLAHLASMLAAEGGDIAAGLVWMRAMLQTEEDETMKDRYRNDIAAFEKALAVQKAIQVFHSINGVYPNELGELVPRYISNLPDFTEKFSLSWNSPTLKLIRPEKTTPSN